MKIIYAILLSAMLRRVGGAERRWSLERLANSMWIIYFTIQTTITKWLRWIDRCKWFKSFFFMFSITSCAWSFIFTASIYQVRLTFYFPKPKLPTLIIWNAIRFIDIKWFFNIQPTHSWYRWLSTCVASSFSFGTGNFYSFYCINLIRCVQVVIVLLMLLNFGVE